MYEEVIKRREKERQAEELKIENCKTEARCFAKANKKKIFEDFNKSLEDYFVKLFTIDILKLEFISGRIYITNLNSERFEVPVIDNFIDKLYVNYKTKELALHEITNYMLNNGIVKYLIDKGYSSVEFNAYNVEVKL